MMSGRLKYLAGIILLLWSGGLFSQNAVLQMDHLGSGQLKVAGFVLHRNTTLQIKAVGAGFEQEFRHFPSYQADPNNMFAYAWILDARSRKMVWRMTLKNTKKVGWSGYNRAFQGDVELPAGTYEVYFSSVEPIFFYGGQGFISLRSLFNKIMGSKREWDDEAEDWMVRIAPVDEVLDISDVRKEQQAYLSNAVVYLVNQPDNVLHKQGFTLKKAARLQIYAQGEGVKGKMFDYGWIINARTNERVWMMEEPATQYAGGAQKNRLVRDTLSFKPGEYLVYYKTDDSHSAEDWNANPPYDPFFWGIVVSPVGKSFDWKAVGKFSEKTNNALVSITRVGDYAYKEAFIKVNRPVKIRIFALGEGRAGQMFDFGWISRAQDGKIVWKMDYDQTRHAGGSSKNRLFDGVITLQPGIYIVHYQTDDSHSYEGWNALPPQRPEMWGITLYNLGTKNAVIKIERPKNLSKNVLAKLTQVGDDEYLKKDFFLDKPSKIRIYCLGEGDPGKMYDYGWIKNVQTGETIWKMRYSSTVHAGGDKKNRMADVIISLPAGHYRVYYKSDDTHSYRHWNAAAPYDERNWGITVYRIK